jgi:hypothetical protein
MAAVSGSCHLNAGEAARRNARRIKLPYAAQRIMKNRPCGLGGCDGCQGGSDAYRFASRDACRERLIAERSVFNQATRNLWPAIQLGAAGRPATISAGVNPVPRCSTMDVSVIATGSSTDQCRAQGFGCLPRPSITRRASAWPPLTSRSSCLIQPPCSVSPLFSTFGFLAIRPGWRREGRV